MIYQIGKLVVGDNWKDLRSWWGQYISNKWMSGVLTYNSEERNLYFLEARFPKNKDQEKTFTFNIDNTHFEYVRRGKMAYHYLILIKDENNDYLFNSDISFYDRRQDANTYRLGKHVTYNRVLIKIINHLKSNK